MPKAIVSRDNTNLAKVRPGKGGQKLVASEVIDNIKDVADMMRDKNNIIIGSSYRLDAKKMAKAEANGICMGDYKLDIQTVTKQKKLSDTIAVAHFRRHADEADALAVDQRDAAVPIRIPVPARRDLVLE